MIDQRLIQRINFLAKKSKNVGLTNEEKEEQANLRKQYLKLFREGFKQQLDSIEIVKEYKEDDENNKWN